MIKVYCEVVDSEKIFKWRIIAIAGELGRYVGEWQTHYGSFAFLKAPTGEDGRIQTWIAGSSYWDGTGKTIGGFPEFTPLSIGDNIGAIPVDVKYK